MSQKEVEPSSDGPLVRSLSMSKNMACSVVDEVPHMIKVVPTADGKRSWWKPSSLRKSSSTSALSNLRKQTTANSVSDTSHVERLSRMEIDPTADNYRSPTLRRGSDGHDPTTYEYDNGLSKELKKVANSDSVQLSLESQLLTPIVKGTRRNDLLVGIVVSRWDNIVGPQSLYLWTEELTSVFYPANLPSPLSKLVKYVTDHTVDHQTVTGGYIHPSVQRTTLCIVPDLNLAYFSLSIRVPTEIDTILEFQTSSPMTASNPDNPVLTMPHSISVLSNLKYLNQFLLLRPLTTSWLAEYGPQIGVLVCKDDLQGSMINSWCAELCKTITALQTCWAQEISDLEENPESSSNLKLTSRSSETDREMYSLQKSLSERLETDTSYLPPHPSFVPKSYMNLLLTCHLTSFGSSIVVGHDCRAINQVIRFLLCFATAQEGYCSRYALATLPDTFMKGLCIQGLILNGFGEKSISHKQVACNRLPLSRIELGSKVKLRQSSITTHFQEKDATILQELQRLWSAPPAALQQIEAFPNLVKDAAGFVTQFLNELKMLPSERRYGRLLLFKRVIHAKALSLITFLHSIQHKPPKDKIKLKQLIPQILGLDSAEYIIVQVTAEKIRPGVMSLLVP